MLKVNIIFDVDARIPVFIFKNAIQCFCLGLLLKLLDCVSSKVSVHLAESVSGTLRPIFSLKSAGLGSLQILETLLVNCVPQWLVANYFILIGLSPLSLLELVLRLGNELLK